MSFRGRLTLFFVLIVIVPMVSVAVVLFRLIADNENGKAAAGTAAKFDTAINVYWGARKSAERAVVKVGQDNRLAIALRDDDLAGARARARALLVRGAKRIVIADGTTPVVDVGRADAISPVSRTLVGPQGRRYGTLQVATEAALPFALRVQRITGLEVVVRSGDALVASTLPGMARVKLPRTQGKIEIDHREYRAASFRAAGFLGRPVTVSVLDPAQPTTSAIARSRLVAAAILIGFFILAFAFAVLVSRSLQRTIESLLAAARRLGGGDFSAAVPVSGRDEFAALAQEFNKMSQQLESRLAELRDERARLQRSMQRIGETFASNLDREALLEIVVRTAIEGVDAHAGRASARSGVGEPLKEVASAGSVEALDDALRDAERQAVRSGRPQEVAVKNQYAMAHPLREADGPERINGVVSVARAGRGFSDAERELFHYLTGQASVSIENVGLHETVERQAVTDELTGLFNRRRFDEVIVTEAERARRFGQQLGLVMLDLDDFKAVNDTHGHPQGDIVLRAVARILRESAREIDEPARLGGEELAVVLPGTDLDGAFKLAERVRRGIEALEIPVISNGGESVRITASFGVATLPASAATVEELIAAADDALYEAKRTGKNRTVRAAAVASPR
jgi:diguanylate cyclase (GGDEF)-like protein